MEQEESNGIIEQALTDLKAREHNYALYQNYYKGKHALAFATDKFKNAFGDLFKALSDNRCPAVVDALCDKLIVKGFSDERGGEGAQSVTESAAAIWKANRMDKRAGEVHLEAVKRGDAYVIVWTNEAGEPVIYPQKANLCTVGYDDENPGKIIWAAKLWQSRVSVPKQPRRKRYRLNLYFPDRIERYVSSDERMPTGASNFTAFAPEGEESIIKNEFGVVPVFHFANNASVGDFGESELRDAKPLQDALNKSICDMLVGAEFAALPQRWATGLEIELDEEGNAKIPFTPGIERIWTSDSNETKFGQFDAANLEPYLKVQESFRIGIASVTGTPTHYFQLVSVSNLSGEALERLCGRFFAKVRDRQISFGNVWEDVITLCLKMKRAADDAKLSCDWQDAVQKNRKDELEPLLIEQSLGIPVEQLWHKAGYSEKQIAAFKELIRKSRKAAIDDFNAE